MSFTAVGSNNQTIWGVQTKQFSGTERSELVDYTDKNSQLINKADSVSGSGAAVKLSGTELLSGVPYYIINQNSGMAIDLPNGKLDEGTNIQQWERNDSWAQQWRIIAVDKDYCKIVSVGDESMCIAVAQSSADDGVNIELQNYTGKDNQLFKIKKCGSDYGIVSKCSNDTGGLDVYEWSKENGGNVNQWNYWEGGCQLWSLSPVHPQVTDGNYMIRSIDSGQFVFDMKGNVVQFDANGKSVQPDSTGKMPFTLNDQIWSFTKLSDGSYTIKNQKGQALAVNSSNKLVVEAASEADNQKFKVICNKDGSYSLLQNDVCIEIDKNSSTEDAGFNINSFTGANTQKFVLEPAIPEEIVLPVKGDVNDDGVMNTADLVMLQKYILGAGKLINSVNADINEDGNIDVFDVVGLRKLLIKQ